MQAGESVCSAECIDDPFESSYSASQTPEEMLSETAITENHQRFDTCVDGVHQTLGGACRRLACASSRDKTV